MLDLSEFYPGAQSEAPAPTAQPMPAGPPRNVADALYAIGGGGDPGVYLSSFQKQYQRITAQQRAQELLGMEDVGAPSRNPGLPPGMRMPSPAPPGGGGVPVAAGTRGIPGSVDGRSAVFGRDMAGRIDTTDVGKLETPFHGSPLFGKKYLPDPELAGAAISPDQAQTLFGGSGGMDSLRRAAAAGFVNVTNPRTGESKPIAIVDVKPSPARNGVSAEVTPRVHRMLGSSPGDRLIYSAPLPQ